MLNSPKEMKLFLLFLHLCLFCLTSNRKLLETSQRMAGLVRVPNHPCRRQSLGTFEVKERGERIGRNPKTKENITIPASKAPTFKVGKALKDAVR